MIASTQSTPFSLIRFYCSAQLNTARHALLVCSGEKLRHNRRLSACERIMAKPLAPLPPLNLSTPGLALPCTRHARRSNPHS
jgi:hypothetical protein